MLIFDAHCDVLTRIKDNGEHLYRNFGHFDIKRAASQGDFYQVAAVFIAPCFYSAPLDRALDVINNFTKEISNFPDQSSLCESANKLKISRNSGKVKIILSLEGGEAVQEKLQNVELLYKLGIRSMMLTWNNTNQIASGCDEENPQKGLTSFGEEVIKEMDRLGMLIDVSHLSEKSFWDVAEKTNRTIFASHSNAKSICNHRRNLTDEQLKCIKEKNGVIGLNIYPPFIKEGERPRWTELIRHIEHILSLLGENYIGLGLDLDGVEELPIGFTGVESYDNMANELLRRNYSETCVAKLMGLNFYEFYIRNL